MDWLGKIENTWTLFLDRDGVVNVRLIDDYVKNIGEFEFLPGVLEAFRIFAQKSSLLRLMMKITVNPYPYSHSFNKTNKNGKRKEIQRARSSRF